MPSQDPAERRLVIAIDGPSGSGKSTLARGVAAALGLRYLDTGAMYRALTWKVLRAGVDPVESLAVIDQLTDFSIDISTEPTRQRVAVGGVDVTREIRSPEVTRAVSAVSAIPDVRRRLVAAQQEIVGAGGIVVEGRDIGTTVCPEAPIKIFLTAHAAARAERRSLDVAGAGVIDPNAAAVLADLDRRDRLDAGRVVSPLAQADDAVAIDSTGLDAGQVLAAVLDLVRSRVRATPLDGVR